MSKKKKHKKQKGKVKQPSKPFYKHKSFIYTTTFLLLLLTVVFSTTFFRGKELEKNKQYTVCKVYDIRDVGYNTRKSRYVYVNFFVNNKKIKASFRKKPYLDIQIGMCFELIYSKINSKNNKINFEKQLNCSDNF